MATAMKIKVRREDLIARVREVQAERDAAYAAAMAAYNSDLPEYREAVALELERVAARIREKPKTDIPSGYRVFDGLKVNHPTKPIKPVKDERLLRQLSLAQDEYLTISVNDYSEYL